jgi:hypothetical protein
MTHRIDDYLDGALDRIALTPEERAQADLLEQAIVEARSFVNATPAPDLRASVMRAVHQVDVRPVPRPSIVTRLADAVWSTREISFRFRPAYAIAIAVAMVLLAGVVSSRPQRSAGVAGQPTLLVQFRLQATEASTVQLAGSFTNWQPQYELHQTAPGIWTITLPLPLGVHDYSFVVDGQRWVADPYAQSVDDGFGGTNSRIAILPPDQPHS